MCLFLYINPYDFLEYTRSSVKAYKELNGNESGKCLAVVPLVGPLLLVGLVMLAGLVKVLYVDSAKLRRDRVKKYLEEHYIQNQTQQLIYCKLPKFSELQHQHH